MKSISDRTLDHLREAIDRPELADGKYEVLESLGRGGMATVYRAIDRELNREVAIKVLDGATSTSDAEERLRQEAVILAQLEHPGLVPVHDVGRLADGRAYYVMKRVRGQRLDEYLEGEVDLSARLGIFERVCEAVAFAHTSGVIHRDLKPGNIMVGRFGEVLVMDWGVAKRGQAPTHPNAIDGRSEEALQPGTAAAPVGASTRGAATAHGVVMGTPGYMSPEQASGEAGRVDHRTDVFALGALLRNLIETAPVNRGAMRPLEAIASKALAEKRDARYGSVEEMAADVARYRAGLSVRAHRETLLDRTRRFAHVYRVPIALVVAYLIMRLALLALAGL